MTVALVDIFGVNPKRFLSPMISTVAKLSPTSSLPHACMPMTHVSATRQTIPCSMLHTHGVSDTATTRIYPPYTALSLPFCFNTSPPPYPYANVFIHSTAMATASDSLPPNNHTASNSSPRPFISRQVDRRGQTREWTRPGNTIHTAKHRLLIGPMGSAVHSIQASSAGQRQIGERSNFGPHRLPSEAGQSGEGRAPHSLVGLPV